MLRLPARACVRCTAAARPRLRLLHGRGSWRRRPLGELRAEGYEPTLNPVDALLSLGAEVTALKDMLRGRVAGADALSDGPAVGAAYERALDRCERTLTSILRLDLETRQVHIAEREAQVLFRAIEASLETIGASAQAEPFRRALAEQLRLHAAS